MSFFRSAQAETPAIAPAYTGLQIQTSSNAVPIPIMQGKTRISHNLIWYNDFYSVAQQQENPSGGKGGVFGGGGDPNVVGYLYYVSLIMALCEGPISAIDRVWKDRTETTLTDLGLSLFAGPTPQTPWSYVTTKHPDEALGYNGLAYVAATSYSLGNSATIGSHAFEVRGLNYGTGINGIDADPALWILDLLTHAQFGAGFPAASLHMVSLNGGAASCQTYCRAQGLALSPAIVNAETAQQVLQRTLDLINTAAVWSGGLLKFVPHADQQITGNGSTFVPEIAPVYELTDDDFLVDGGGEDPVTITRSDPLKCYNIWRLEASDRANAYNLAPVEVRDQDAIERFGARPSQTVTAHEICDLAMANIAAQLMLQRNLTMRNTYTFRLPWEFLLLDPMDVVSIAQSYLIEAGTQVRIKDIEEDEDGLFTVTAEDFLPGTMTAVAYPAPSATGGGINTGEAAPAVNTPLIFEAPLDLAKNKAVEIWFGASPVGAGGANWGGARVWLSLDDAGYGRIGTITAPLRQGVLAANLPAYAASNPDLLSTLAADMSMSGGVLSSVSTDDAAAEVTLSLVGDELLAFQNAQLTAADRYNLTSLYRGLHDTAAGLHNAGAAFAKLDGALFKYAVPSTLIGKDVWVKFQSFNEFGNGLQDLADCVAYPFTISGPTSAAPTGLTAIGSNGFIDLYCTNPNSATFQYVRFYSVAPAAPFNTNAPVGGPQYGAANGQSHVQAAMAAGTYDFYAVAVNNAGVVSTPAGPAQATVT